MSKPLYEYLDFGGVGCISCAKSSGLYSVRFTNILGYIIVEMLQSLYFSSFSYVIYGLNICLQSNSSLVMLFGGCVCMYIVGSLTMFVIWSDYSSFLLPTFSSSLSQNGCRISSVINDVLKMIMGRAFCLLF